MHIIYGLAWLLAAWKWGDWRNSSQYYPTFLFLSFWDLCYQFLLFNHPMWIFNTSFDKRLLPNHTFIVLFRMFTIYLSTVLIFLHHFPNKGLIKKILYILFFVLIYFGMELINHYGWKGISYHHGWNIYWSALLDTALFIALRIHFKHSPFIAWLFGVVFSITLWFIFQISISELK
ncbi:CBO0543 family protein [Heyndrickxia ginsengihumi]|uniref:Uncharacterized protein n=1 Tax=Heyndrickxia ginsengihumi TaxID=363870 RepID=A0A0A6VHH7_9BACI|nr:CBO0543 family protein [Heyndrickxia ginsengihumi]KHD86079.1 hypothetical protein NG54_05550 [Heyndrickxia ginsengihumi]MBE6184503.1 hypothetical protein [Bacillus sp. (in: firmicutes)]MCM3023509.1 hypothetical protein [Heyndrickxia ginsengihumi]NEY20335.1 hypothetical protein [Heyndrickxia ginsengihumi]